MTRVLNLFTPTEYTNQTMCQGSNQLSASEDSDWHEAPVIYNTINAPQKSVVIDEIYFDTAEGTKLKFAGFKC